jgi:hypothetical protein
MVMGHVQNVADKVEPIVNFTPHTTMTGFDGGSFINCSDENETNKQLPGTSKAETRGTW